MTGYDWQDYSQWIAKKISFAMSERGLTQAALARMIGCTQQYVSRIVRGRENLTLDTLAKIESALDVGVFKHHIIKFDPWVLKESSAPYSSSWSEPCTVSSEPVIKVFETGDRPMLVRCGDGRMYLCKYNPGTGRSYSLARELTGSRFAGVWGLCDMDLAFVNIRPQDLPASSLPAVSFNNCLGRQWDDDVMDVNNTSSGIASRSNAEFLLKVVLFDIWLANEDRIINNTNLLYDCSTRRFKAIDHAGIFNQSFSPPLQLLELEDTLLYSDLFTDACKSLAADSAWLSSLKDTFSDNLDKCRQVAPLIWKSIPESWKIDCDVFDEMMSFLFSPDWTEPVWDQFNTIIIKASAL